MRTRQLKHKCLPGLFLLILFAGYASCIFGFRHVHVIDGIRIIHSHPYSEGHENNTHTQVEIILLADASHFVADRIVPGYFDFTPYQTIEAVFDTGTVSDVIRKQQLIVSLRAPPIV